MSEIEDGCFVAPQVTFTNDNFMGRSAERFAHHGGVIMRKGSRVGGGAVIYRASRLGEDSVSGAGALVSKNVPTRKLVYGAVPAKVMRDVPDDQLLGNQ